MQKINVWFQYNSMFIKSVLQTSDNIIVIFKWIMASLLILTLLEAIYYPQIENVYGCLIFIIGWGLIYRFVIKTSNRTRCFFPFIAFLGLGIMFFWLPLLITFIEGKPLTFRFSNPYLTFNNQLLNLIMLIGAYGLCRKYYKPKNWLQRIWLKIGYFTPPTDKQVWTMGVIGLMSFILTVSIMGTEESKAENLGITGHLLMVMRNFAAFPFILLFKDVYGGKKEGKSYKIFFIGYMVIFIAIALSTGKRSPILGPFAAMTICYLLPAITINKKIFSARNTFLGVVCLYWVAGPVTDIAVAMALGRDNQKQTSASRTFDNIIKIYQDKELLHTLYRMSLEDQDNKGYNSVEWSEYYVDNILFDRFCNLRVCDATLYYADKLGYDNPKMQEYLSNQILFQLPTPVLNMLNIHVNKFQLNYSPGDLISTLGLGTKYQYHGYRVAGDTGIGLFLWGYKYYFFAFFIYFAFFYFMSTRTLTTNTGHVIIPLPETILLMATFFTLNNASGIVGPITTLLRLGWQSIAVYCVIYFIIRKMVK